MFGVILKCYKFIKFTICRYFFRVPRILLRAWKSSEYEEFVPFGNSYQRELSTVVYRAGSGPLCSRFRSKTGSINLLLLSTFLITCGSSSIRPCRRSRILHPHTAVCPSVCLLFKKGRDVVASTSGPPPSRRYHSGLSECDL